MPKFHNSILAYVVSLAGLLTALHFFFIPSVFAAASNCTPSTTGRCQPTQYSCSVNSGGSISVACCSPLASGPSDCSAYKATNPRTPSGNSTSPTQGQGALKVNPEGKCSGGIDTALGCIPYDTKGFTAALLGFLAGIVGLIALIVMIIATIMVMTGGSNPEQVKKGKELFTGGITGLFFIIFSVTILRIIAGDIIKLPGF